MGEKRFDELVDSWGLFSLHWYFLKLIAKFIPIFCHCLLLLQMFSPMLFWGVVVVVREGVRINSTFRITACFV